MIRRLVSVTAGLLLTACATAPPPSGAIDDLRSDLQALEQNQALAGMAPAALADARQALREAASGDLGADQREQKIWLARKRIEIARASAEAERARRDLQTLRDRRAELLVRASRLEAEQARRAAEQALMESVVSEEQAARERARAMSAEERRELATREAEQANAEAEQARRVTEAQAREIELARREAELASETAASLQRRLEYMEYRQTDRGVVVTLGDVLFAVGESALLPEAAESLADVIELLESEPDRQIRIEGHTDATGAAAFNLRLSQARADSVRNALIERGIDPERMTAVGMGEDFPIATNETEAGRARNRRVDVIVLNQ